MNHYHKASWVQSYLTIDLGNENKHSVCSSIKILNTSMWANDFGQMGGCEIGVGSRNQCEQAI